MESDMEPTSCQCVDMGMLFRPDLFIIVLLVCLVFNLLAVLLPATLAVRKNIVVTLKGGE